MKCPLVRHLQLRASSQASHKSICVSPTAHPQAARTPWAYQPAEFGVSGWPRFPFNSRAKTAPVVWISDDCASLPKSHTLPRLRMIEE